MDERDRLTGNEKNTIARYNLLRDIGDGVATRTEAELHDAYRSAIKTHASTKGGIHVSRLDNYHTAVAFADDLARQLFTAAQKYLGGHSDTSEDTQTMSVFTTYGITPFQLKQLAVTQGRRLTPQQFMQIAANLIARKIKPAIEASASEHIQEEHINDILQHTHTTNRVKPFLVDTEAAKDLLKTFYEQDDIPVHYLQSQTYSNRDLASRLEQAQRN